MTRLDSTHDLARVFRVPGSLNGKADAPAPVRLLDGSMARTASVWPWPTMWRPSASMNVDLPTPGAPLMPDLFLD